MGWISLFYEKKPRGGEKKIADLLVFLELAANLALPQLDPDRPDVPQSWHDTCNKLDKIPLTIQAVPIRETPGNETDERPDPTNRRE